jgi:hypothetical protein
MRKQTSFRKKLKQLLDDSIHAGRSLAARHDGALPAYECLLRQVQCRTALLRPSDRAGDYRNLVNADLLALACITPTGCGLWKRGFPRRRKPGLSSPPWPITSLLITLFRPS